MICGFILVFCGTANHSCFMSTDETNVVLKLMILNITFIFLPFSYCAENFQAARTEFCDFFFYVYGKLTLFFEYHHNNFIRNIKINK